jgi:acyl-CoA thioesterase
MDQDIKRAIERGVEREPFAQALKMELKELETGFSAVEMTYQPALMDNLFGRAHGGAVFALIDEAFEAVCQSEGVVTVGLNVSVTYVSSPRPGARLRAEAREISRTAQTVNYSILVRDQDDRVITTCQALVFRTGKPLPFVEKQERDPIS